MIAFNLSVHYTEREVITRGMTFTSAMSVRCYEVIHQVAFGERHLYFRAQQLGMQLV